MSISLRRHRILVVLISLLLFFKLFSLQASWVEKYYSTGVYLFLSRVERSLLGWLPFSFGDLLYIFAIGFLLYKVICFFKLLVNKELKKHLSLAFLLKYTRLVLAIYGVFLLFWGLNYYRLGIAQQINISLQPYTKDELFALTTRLQEQVNFYGEKIDSIDRDKYNHRNFLIDSSVAAYQRTADRFSFLSYKRPSLKSSLFSPIGQYIGFTGYYNPFTAEAQIKTSIPVFLKPFVATHEIGHQLGYAKENEASFVAYLACRESGNTNFLYSAYFELYKEAFFNCRETGDTAFINGLRKNLGKRFLYDAETLRQYLLKNKNPVEPLMSVFYDKYLKINNQPNGKATYNEVIAYLVAYMRKFGRSAI